MGLGLRAGGGWEDESDGSGTVNEQADLRPAPQPSSRSAEAGQ